MNASSAQKPLPERSRWQRELAQAITDPRVEQLFASLHKLFCEPRKGLR